MKIYQITFKTFMENCEHRDMGQMGDCGEADGVCSEENCPILSTLRSKGEWVSVEQLKDLERIIESSANEILKEQCGLDLSDHICYSICHDILIKHQKEYLRKYSRFLTKSPPQEADTEQGVKG